MIARTTFTAEGQKIESTADDAPKTYDEARALVDKYLNHARLLGRAEFEQKALALVDELSIESFSWTQYTPYFNDGDACIFSVHASYPEINGVDKWEIPDEAEREAMKDSYEKVTVLISSYADDDMKEWFDDHSRVTVTKDGVVSTEYNHD